MRQESSRGFAEVDSVMGNSRSTKNKYSLDIYPTAPGHGLTFRVVLGNIHMILTIHGLSVLICVHSSLIYSNSKRALL